MSQICIEATTSLAAIATSVIACTAFVNNLMPAPDTITNPVLKFISKITHFLALDITTAAK